MKGFPELIQASTGRSVALGIDAGVHTGAAVWDRRGHRFLWLKTVDFWDGIGLISGLSRAASLVVLIEDPGQNRPVFGKNIDGNDLAIKLKMAQDVGSNKAFARLMIQYCERHHLRFVAVKPTKKKWDAALFRRFTRYEGRTNEHTRDAGRLVYDF